MVTYGLRPDVDNKRSSVFVLEVNVLVVVPSYCTVVVDISVLGSWVVITESNLIE